MKNQTPLRSSQNTNNDFAWRTALDYYRSRGVLFVSYQKFWERYGFVQRILAKLLSENGVPVVWVDGFGWRHFERNNPWPNENLSVRQMFEFPGRRWHFVKELTKRYQERALTSVMDGMGGNPVIWVQGGTDIGFADIIPYVDILSTFDDPRRPELSTLGSLARLIYCQNSFTYEDLHKKFPEKSVLAFPPVEMDQGTFQQVAPISYPANFPKRKMGYIGAFKSEDYDLILFETFVRRLPEWGFILAGRTDGPGEKMVEKLSQYENFLRLPWGDRRSLAPVWKSLEVSLLLYRPYLTQDGAFPTKIVESTFFGVPTIATKVPKTQDLEGLFFRSNYPEELIAGAVRAAEGNRSQVFLLHDQFKQQTDPKAHLIQAADRLSKSFIRITA